MLNKNASCYDIENNFKYSTVIITFSEHITIFRTFSIDIWQLKCQQRETDRTKNGELYFWKFFFLIILREATLESKVVPANRNSSALLLYTSKTFSIFSQTFLELIFTTKIKTMLLKQSAVKKILHILCVWTLKILYTNKRILT